MVGFTTLKLLQFIPCLFPDDIFLFELYLYLLQVQFRHEFRFQCCHIQFQTNVNRIQCYEIEYHTIEIQFQACAIQFQTNDIQFHTNEIHF